MRRVMPLAALAAVLAGGNGCGRDEVAHYRVPKEAPAAVEPAAMGEPAPAAKDLPRPPVPEGTAALTWTLPAGWTQEAGGSAMRYATLHAPVTGKVDVSVTVLPGDAGGELANVNRWRNQIALPPIDAAGLASARKPVKTAAGTLSLYDFASEAGEKRRLVAGLALVDGSSWFIKMTGEAGAVGQARADFLRLVESVRREAVH